MAQVNAGITTNAKGENRIVLESHLEHQERIAAIMGAHWNKETEKWELPLTWSACVALYNTFGPDFRTSTQLDHWGTAERNKTVGPAMTMRERLDVDGLIEKPGDRSSEVTAIARDIGTSVGLFKHQQAGAAFIAITNGVCAITDEQGTGKSPQLITGVRTLQRYGEEMFPLLVVCPSSVKTHWEREWTKWYPGLTVVKVSGTAVQRRKQLATPAHVYIINFELVPKYSKLAHYPGAAAMKRCGDCGGFDPAITEKNCQSHVRELNKIPFSTVVVDEAHRILDPKSTWTRSVWAIGDKAKHRVAMTGTPVQDTIEDTWPLNRFVKPDEFPAKGKYMDRYAIQAYNHWGAIEVRGVNPAHADELQQIMQPFYRRMLKDIVLPFLPPVMQEIRTVEMVGAQGKAYREMKKKMMVTLKPGATPMIATTPLTKATRLMQLASSYAEVIDESANEPDPNDPTGDIEVSVKLLAPSNKIDAFMDDVSSGDYDGNAGVIVFAQSKQLLDLLSEAMKRKKIDHGMVTGGIPEADRQADIDRFQAGGMKFILVSISAGGAGLTLTAADTMVYLQRAWSSTAMEQSKARAHRIGSQIHQSIRQVDYVSENSIELHQLDALQGKAGRIEEILKDDAAIEKFLKDAA